MSALRDVICFSVTVSGRFFTNSVLLSLSSVSEMAGLLNTGAHGAIWMGYVHFWTGKNCVVRQ